MTEITRWRRFWLDAWLHRWHVRYHVPRFLRACPEPFRGEVLEVGAGSGHTSRQILDTFPQVELTAVDIDEQATATFAQMQQHYGRRLKVKKANVLKLWFDRESFDVALAINVMPHLRPYAIKVAVQELLRVTRPGGLIGISDHLLLSAPRKSSRQAVDEAISQENCDILYVAGGSRFDMWIRKPYPVEGGGS